MCYIVYKFLEKKVTTGKCAVWTHVREPETLPLASGLRLPVIEKAPL
jgi:hypothetical protein